MENNMAMEYPMFCYQCEQTAGGKGCTKMGVCGKTPEVAADIFRRGYENGSTDALATREQMNRYVNVGSLDADGFYNKDSAQARKIYNIINNYNG